MQEMSLINIHQNILSPGVQEKGQIHTNIFRNSNIRTCYQWKNDNVITHWSNDVTYGIMELGQFHIALGNGLLADCIHLCPLLLTWFNFNPCMDK